MNRESEAPAAEERPVRITAGGVEYDDPYVWLEEDSAETLAWQAAQNAVAARRLRDVEGFDALKEALEEDIGATFVSAPHGRDDRWIRLAHGDGGERLERAADPSGPWRPILAIEDFSRTDGAASLDWFFPSPDGQYVALGVSWGGDEQCVLRLLDVEREEVLPVSVPDTWFSRVAWLPDSSGFYFAAGPFVMDQPRDVAFLAPGDEEPSRDSLAALDLHPASGDPPGGYPQVSADGRWLTVASERFGGRIFLARRLPDGAWFEVLEDRPAGRAYGFVDGDDYVAVVTEGAPRGRLVRFPLEAAHARSTWTELLPESDEVLVSVDPVAGHYVVASLVDATARLRVLDRDGHLVAEVPLPEHGVVAEHAVSVNYKVFPPMEGGSIVPCGAAFTFTFTSPGRSPAAYLFDIPTRRLTRLQPPAVVLDGVTAESCTAAGTDGREARYTLVTPGPEELAAPRPTLIFGYGGFNCAFVPAFLGKLAPFVLAGGNVVIAHLRGGGEFGEQQWHEGRMANKQGTFDDLCLIAEALIAEGVTSPARLGLVGESNGGLLTAAALAQRPDLWGAVCVQVPLTDVLHMENDPIGSWAACTEYGDAESPIDAPRLAAWSPYQNVRDAVYPPTLIWTGENDARCAPWHARKFAARVRAANRGPNAVLLRVRSDGGHLSVGTDPDQVAEWLGFLMRELGLPVPEGQDAAAADRVETADR
jgi:prolyl oligopeptidase